MSQIGNPTGIKEFKISSAFTDDAVDMVGGAVQFNYYESILSNKVTATATIIETGYTNENKKGENNAKGALDGLPIKGGERADIKIEDSKGKILEFSDSKALYVNRVRDINPETLKDNYYIDFTSQEYFRNEQVRVVKRYDGKISDNIIKILGLLNIPSDSIEVDKTAIPYNFIGNDRKPFYICTWLASKSVPESTADGNAAGIGGAAGYLFYQTRDGFHFKAIDKLFEGKVKRKFIYNDTADISKNGDYDGKIVSYGISREIDLHQNMTLGTYNNRSLFFDFLSMNYKTVEYNIEYQKQKINPAGDYFNISEEYTKSPCRLMNHILDYGTLPSGRTQDAQLKSTPKDQPKANYDAEKTMSQSIMRYNQLFTIQTDIVIPGDFSIRAGDVVECTFPQVMQDGKDETNKFTSGKYIVAHVCHKIGPNECLSSLGLIRDSFGKKT